MSSWAQYTALCRQPGLGWLAYRALYAWRLRTGSLRRATSITRWEDVPASRIRLRNRLGKCGRVGAAAVTEAEAVIAGRFRLFSHRSVDAGMMPDWWRNHLTASSRGKTGHWSNSGDSAGADIKGIWELSRFTWAFALARAHARSKDVRYATAFWRLWDDWLSHNQPNEGPNWMCGQEATFRLMSVIWAAETMRVPAEQEAPLARFVIATGRRIAGNLNYALSQKNNHGISECVGLITVALCVPEHPESPTWLDRGTKHLQSQLSELVYPDGSFSQHSLIYQRVLLHDLVWCVSRLREAQQPVPDWLQSAGERALDFMAGLVDPQTGRAPLFGSNDGANILPLSDGEFLDMRPTIQMTAAVFRGELPLPEGQWDEAAEWLAGPIEGLRRVSWPVAPALHHATNGGYLALSNGSNRLFLRCPTAFKHRPAQADMLHVDIWQDGKEVACDGGSFSYNSSERFVHLADAAQHNVLTVDGLEPMEKFSRFLYLPWPRGAVEAQPDGEVMACHDAYARLGIKWTRRVASKVGGGFMVCDRVMCAANRLLRWHWRLADENWELHGTTVSRSGSTKDMHVRWHSCTATRVQMMKSDSATAYGWRSEHYGEVCPATSLIIEAETMGDTEIVFEFLPDEK